MDESVKSYSDNPADYHAIALWGRQLGSFRYYIEAQQEKAARDKAPLDAIYKNDSIGQDGSWSTMAELKPEHPFWREYQVYIAEVKSGRLRPYYNHGNPKP